MDAVNEECGDRKRFFAKALPGGFKVAFEANGLVGVGKRDGGLDPPRTQLARVRYFSSVVSFEPLSQIVSMADVKMLRVVLALEHIDVTNGTSYWLGLPSRSSERLQIDA